MILNLNTTLTYQWMKADLSLELLNPAQLDPVQASPVQQGLVLAGLKKADPAQARRKPRRGKDKALRVPQIGTVIHIFLMPHIL